MCTHGDGTPGGYAEALAMAASGLDYLNAAAASGELADPVLGEVLLGLETAGAKQAAARASVLARFDAAGAHDADAYQNSTSWLRDKTGMTHGAARRQVKQMRVLRSRPRLAAGLGAGLLSESWLERIVTWTRTLPADMLDTIDALILSVLEAGGDLDDVYLVITAAVESERAQNQPGPADPDDSFDDRSLHLDTTLDGAGVLRGNLTPEAAAALAAILESLGKKQGREDTRTKAQRDHDALAGALHRLLGARLLPARAGSDTRAEVRISFAELMSLPGAPALTEAWLRGRTGEPGWLLGKDAETAACDAMIVPVVTATPDWAVITEMACLVLDALGQHGIPVPATARPGTDTGDAGDTAPADRPPVPLPPEAWQALLHALGRLAVKFVSGPGAIASLLRTGLAPAPYTGKSVPLDVGVSSRIPDAIRRAVIARAGGHCEWPGGCDVPAAGCDVHHITHRKDGGPTSVSGAFLGCQFHHDVAIHRWGWTIDLQADGTFTATSPDRTQVIRGRPARGRRPPPGRAA